MNKRILLLISALVASAMTLASYIVVTGLRLKVASAQVRPEAMPDAPHILYIVPEGTQRGLLTEQVVRTGGAIPVTNWETARRATELRALDAILIDASMVEQMTPADIDWLQTQFFDGVVVVGLGTDDDRLAKILGLETLLDPSEVPTPIGPTGYRLVYCQVLGLPDDIEKIASPEALASLESKYKDRPDLFLRDLKALWVNHWITHPGVGGPDGIQHPMVNSFGKARGSLDTDKEIDRLFLRINTAVEGAYQVRADFKAAMEASKEPQP